MATNQIDDQRNCRLAFLLPTLEGGGAERAVVALANQVAELDKAVDLILGDAVGSYMAEVSSKVQIINLSSRGKFSFLLQLIRYIRHHNPSVIMSSLDHANILLILATRLTGFKGRTAISQRATIGPVYAQYGWLRRMVYRFLISLTFPYADSIICNSHAASMEIQKLSRICKDRVFTIHNSVDVERTNRLANEPLNDSWHLNSQTPLVLSVGSLTTIKDRGTLIRAFKIVKAQRNARLAILGEGYGSTEYHKIDHLISECGLNGHVYLPGFKANPFNWMSKAAVLVSSSITEGCPNQLLEALSLGVPIVATDCPGDTAELLGHGRWGKLVPVGDAERMADAILTTLDNPHPSNGRVRAGDFSPSKTLRAYLCVLLPEFYSEGQAECLQEL
jgi:glycosyltransferase involved in cell wall biosynthesis